MKYIDPCLVSVNSISNSNIVSVEVSAERNKIQQNARIEFIGVDPPYQVSIAYAGVEIFKGILKQTQYSFCETIKATYESAMPTEQADNRGKIGASFMIVTNKMLRQRVREALNGILNSLRVPIALDEFFYISLPTGFATISNIDLRWKVIGIEFGSGYEIPNVYIFTHPAYDTYIATLPPPRLYDSVGIIVWVEGRERETSIYNRSAVEVAAISALSPGRLVANCISMNGKVISASIETSNDILALCGADVFDPDNTIVDGVHTIDQNMTIADVVKRYTSYSVLGYDPEQRRFQVTKQNRISRTFNIPPSAILSFDITSYRKSKFNVVREQFVALAKLNAVYAVSYPQGQPPSAFRQPIDIPAGYASVGLTSTDAGGYSSEIIDVGDSATSGFLFNTVYKNPASLAKQLMTDRSDTAYLQTILLPDIQPYTKVSFASGEWWVVSYTHRISHDEATTSMNLVEAFE
jgi:hypothetical protein